MAISNLELIAEDKYYYPSYGSTKRKSAPEKPNSNFLQMKTPEYNTNPIIVSYIY